MYRIANSSKLNFTSYSEAVRVYQNFHIDQRLRFADAGVARNHVLVR
jgi:hypothetical protein